MNLGPKALSQIKHLLSWRFQLFTLSRLPSLWFWGVRVEHINASKCEVSIPYKWSSKNPFKSTYFAALAGAAELSTGLLVQLHLADRGKWSMLVTNVNLTYHKKCTETVSFRCDQGKEIVDKIESAIQTNNPQQFVLTSTGYTGTEVMCEAQITWSIKKK